MRTIIAVVIHIMPAVFLAVSTWALLPEEAQARTTYIQESGTMPLASQEKGNIALHKGLAYHGMWGAAFPAVRGGFGKGVLAGMTYDEAQAEVRKAARAMATGIVFMVLFGIGTPLSIAWAVSNPTLIPILFTIVCGTFLVIGLIMLIAGAAEIAELKRELAYSTPYLSGEDRGFAIRTARAQTFHGVALPMPAGLELRF